MKSANRQTGYLAENMAIEDLKKKDYQILDRNFANRFGEIDIIAKDKDILVFVEVKSKIGADFGAPEEMINQLDRNFTLSRTYPATNTTGFSLIIITFHLL